MPNAPKAMPTTREMAMLAAISAAAHEQGLGQDDLAEAAGVSQSQVSRVLSGKRPVTLTELIALLGAVGLDLETVARELGL